MTTAKEFTVEELIEALKREDGKAKVLLTYISADEDAYTLTSPHIEVGAHPGVVVLKMTEAWEDETPVTSTALPTTHTVNMGR